MTNFTIFNQLTAMPKRLAMVLTVLFTLGVGQMWGAENGDTFARISNASDLSDGDEIIFVYQTGTYACGTTQNTNNRTPVAITTSSNSYSYKSTDNVQVFVVKVNGSNYGFHTSNGYIYSASSSNNYLKTNTTASTTSPSGTSAWTLSVSNNVFTVQNTSNTSYYLAFNGTSYFSQYKSGQSKPYIYKKQTSSGGGNTGGDSGDDSGNSSDAEWTLVTDASTLKNGDQIVIASNAKGFVAGAITDDYMANSSAVTFSADKSSITSLPDDAEILTLGGTSSAWTLTNEEDKQLGATAVKKVAWNSGTKTWSISISNNDATIQNGTSSYGRFLHNVNSTRFTTYASNTSSSMLLPQIYKKNSPSPTTACNLLTFTTNITANNTATYTQNASANALTVAAQYDGNSTGVTYQWYSNTTNSNTGGTLISDATNASYTPLTTAAGTKYYYCVATYDECTITSNAATVVTNLPQLATPTNLNASNITATSATLTWDWSDNENEAYLNGYNLYYKKLGDANFTGPLTCNTNSSERTGLTPNTQYVFKVAATSNKTGECKSSEQSAEFTFTTASPTQLSKPTGLKVTNISATSATLSWSAVANASSYLVTIVDGGDLSADVPNDQTSYTFTNLTPETDYLWTVKAIGDNVNYTDSEESETGEFTTTSATCTVTYYANGGTGIVPSDGTEYNSGAEVTVKGNYGVLTKSGYAFTGWNTAADGSGTPYKAGDIFTITGNTTLYAQWCEAYWKLVTKTSEIENDTRIVIAAKDYDVAMSTTQNTNNRGQATITKKYNTISFEPNVQTLALVKLVAEDKFYLFTGTGYLYAASSSSNYLKTGTSVDNNYKWTFAINEGVATINASGDKNHNQIKYNHQQSGQLFSCYEPSNTTMYNVVIYKEVCKQDAYKVNIPSLTNVTAANENATTVSANSTSLTLNYTANTGYLLPETITIKMGGATLVSGTDYTWNKEDGQLELSVDGFYGDVDVKIVAEADPCYGFEMSTVTATSTTNSITLTWTEVSGATGYNVKLGAGDFTAATGTSHTFEGLSPKTSYNWEVQAVKNGANFHCEASKTGSTTTQKETFTVSWIVNGDTENPHTTESVVDGEKIKNYPATNPSAPLGCSTKVFVGWTDKTIETPTNDAPTLYTAIGEIPAITANTTYYAVFADETGEGETTKSLLNTEIQSFHKQGTTTSYSDLTIPSTDGDWSGLFCTANSSSVYTINLKKDAVNDKRPYLKSSEYNSITKVSVVATHASTKGNRTLYLCNDATDSPESNNIGTISVAKDNNSSQLCTLSSSATTLYLYVDNSIQIKTITLTTGGTTYSAYTTLCDNCTPSTLIISADKFTENLGVNGKAVITFTHEDGNGGEITYTANPASGVSWNGAVATFSKAGTYTISASQAKNGDNCPTISNEVEITITAIPVLYFTTEPANPIVFDPVECGSHTRLEDKKTVSLQGYNLTSPVAVTVTGPYKIARTLESTLADYTTELSLDNNQDGTINNNYDDIHILSYPPVGLSNPTTGTLTFTTTGGNKLTVNLSTPEITCTAKTLTINDRGTKTYKEYFAGTEVLEPEEPTDICTDPILYEFDGWSFTTVENGSTEYTEVEFPFNMPANNQTTLHSVFKYIEEEVTKYTTTLECTTCQKTNIHVDNHKTIVKETTLELTTLVTSVNTSAFVFTCEDNYATLSGSIFTATQAGTYTINVTQEEDATYCATSATITIKVVATSETWGITWNVAGRTNTGLSPRTVYKGEPIGTLPTPTTPAGCEGKHFMGWTTTRSVNNDGIGITYIDHNTTPTENSTYYAVFAEPSGSGAGEQLFYESFNACDSKGGNDGTWSEITTSKEITIDGWSFIKGYQASQCARLGTQSIQGSAQTPTLNLNGDATLTFLAGAWNGSEEETTINLEIEGGGTIEPTSVTLTKGEFTNYTANITGGTVNTRVKFTATQTSKNRFFLDEVRVYAKGDVPATYIDYTTSCGDYLVTYYGFTGGYSTTCDGNPGEIAVPQGSDYMIPNCTPTTDPQDLGRTFAGTWNTKANGSGTSYTPGATIEYVNDNITLYAQWTMATSGNTTLPTDESGIADLANTDVIVHGGNTLTLAEGTTTIKSLTLKGGIQEDKSYAMPIVKIPDNATLVRKDNKINLDLKINNQNFYPFAVPFEVANTAANINYINQTLKEYVNNHNGYGTFYVIREYDGERRADKGVDQKNNWKHVGRTDVKLLPGKGYIISAVPAAGTDTVTIRITMTVDNKWLANGEQTTITSGSKTTTRNQVAVTAYTGTAATNDPCNAGWNFVANPYLTHFAGASMKDNNDQDLDYIEGEIIVKNGHFEHDGTEIPYVTVPAANFGWYEQYRVSDVKLSPMWSFFVQIGTDGTMNFTTAGRQQAPAALRANAAAENPRIEANLAILYGEQKANHTGLIIDDNYTSDYEIGADLEKMFGSAYNTTIYTLSNSTRLAYNALPHHVAQMPIPLGFRAAEEGDYTISLTNYEDITGVESIILHDLYTDIKTNLLHLDYSFYTDQTQDDNRFVVYLVPRNNTTTDLSTIIDEAQNSENRKVLINNHLYIIHNGKVYNGAGQIVK